MILLTDIIKEVDGVDAHIVFFDMRLGLGEKLEDGWITLEDGAFYLYEHGIVIRAWLPEDATRIQCFFEEYPRFEIPLSDRIYFIKLAIQFKDAH